MNEKIVEFAREAGFTDRNGFCEVIVRHSNGSWIGVKDELERFHKLAQADFKERLAQAIEQMPFGDTAASFAAFVREFK